MRYLPRFRNTRGAVENIRPLALTGERVSIEQRCKVEERDEGPEIYREGNERHVPIKYSVRGLGVAVGEAIEKVNKVSLQGRRKAAGWPWIGGAATGTPRHAGQRRQNA